MEYAIAKMSTKGQIVIPSSLRKDLNTGEEFLLVKNKSNFILKRVTDLASNLIEDIEFSNKVENAWEEYETGKITKSNKNDFLEELEQW